MHAGRCKIVPAFMLLLTDNPAEARRFQAVFSTAQPCTMLSLTDARRHPPVHSMIACHVDLVDASSAEWTGAIAHHRPDPRVPMLVLLRDPGPQAEASAKAMDATEIRAHATSPEELVAALKRCRISYKVRRDAPLVAPDSSLEGSIDGVGGFLRDLFGAVARRQAVPLATLGSGAEALIASVKRAEIKRWLHIVRGYDDATYQHCLLVAGLVAAFAMRLGWSLDKQHVLAQAALVHDIGKAFVPRDILNKTGPLTHAECEAIRRHPAEGHRMLAGQPGLDPAILDVVRHHHEMLDGSGYPDRLRRAQISEGTRLVTICDIYGALVERRPYKPPMTPEQGRAVLHGMDGKLDAGLLRAFDTIIRDA